MSSKAPWESYADELDLGVSPELAKEVEAYSQRRHESTSSQNLEELARQREINYDMAREHQWDHQWELTDEKLRLGNIKHSSWLITKLRNECKVNCWFNNQVTYGFVGLRAIRKEGEGPVFVCGVQHGYMPEYSVMRIDQWGVPTREKYRGWRTVLLRLILGGFITEDMANKVFGEATGPASRRYNQTLFYTRKTNFQI